MTSREPVPRRKLFPCLGFYSWPSLPATHVLIQKTEYDEKCANNKMLLIVILIVLTLHHLEKWYGAIGKRRISWKRRYINKEEYCVCSFALRPRAAHPTALAHVRPLPGFGATWRQRSLRVQLKSLLHDAETLFCSFEDVLDELQVYHHLQGANMTCWLKKQGIWPYDLSAPMLN